MLANHGDQFVAGVGVGGVRQHVLLRVKADSILMTAENVDGIAADAQTGAGDLSLVNGIADGGVSGSRAFRAHVPLGSEAGHQVGFGGQSGGDHALGYRLQHGLKCFVPGMEEEMDVGIDQAGHQGRVPKIDGFDSGGVLDGRAGGDDLFPLDQDLARGKDAAAFNVEQARSVKNDRVSCRGRLRQCSRHPGGEAEQDADEGSTVSGQDGLQNIADPDCALKRISIGSNYAAAQKDPRGHL